jgi:hypothetical protein
MTIDELKHQIQALSASDRADLLIMLEYDESRTPFLPDRQESDFWDMLVRLTPAPLHHALNAFLGDKRHGVPRATYREAVETVYHLVAEAQPVRHNVQDHAALAALVLDCLAQDLIARDIAVNPKNMIEELPRLRVAVNKCFPGYIDAKLLHKLIRVVAAAQ